MASEQEVRQYLAYWFQLGKKVLLSNGHTMLPQPVIRSDRYSQEFEDCWRLLLTPDSGDCYLEGTEETITEMLTPAWEVSPCARCDMPIPVHNIGMPPSCCPCNDLSNWPNTEVPAPRSPVSTQRQLMDIRARLLKGSG